MKAVSSNNFSAAVQYTVLASARWFSPHQYSSFFSGESWSEGQV